MSKQYGWKLNRAADGFEVIVYFSNADGDVLTVAKRFKVGLRHNITKRADEYELAKAFREAADWVDKLAPRVTD